MNDKRQCNDIANKQDAWSVGMVEDTYWGTVYAWISCSRCGAFWKTTAKYKRQIAGAENFRELFDKEEEGIINNLKDKIEKLDQQINQLQQKKATLERRLHKRQMKKPPSYYG